ncbi:uncharacterized protein LOC114536209 [Dendronephthya gigantea]|uniref:uncharacterized protein LOC114536209 n=1 Tax=Dendronephthya gigantea TaxID=151771 RepID=UPI00106D809F|nr:uncharacterized protein LOC114536209 [Dendronephthya gigantea]
MVDMLLTILLTVLATSDAHSISRVQQIPLQMSRRVKDTPPYPQWPPMFQQSFNETFTYPILGSHSTSGTYYYDFENRRYKIVRENGRYDRYCGFNGEHTLSDTPCTQLVVKGQRWLIYPDKKECCKCCTSEQGCGVLFPTWMVNATFLGKVKWHDGTMVYKWDKQGLQHNYYYETIADDPEDRILLQIDQQPNDDQIYNRESRKLVIENPDEVFQLPSYCESAGGCSFFSTCHAVG